MLGLERKNLKKQNSIFKYYKRTVMGGANLATTDQRLFKTIVNELGLDETDVIKCVI